MVDIVCLGHILNEKIIFPDRIIHPVLGSPVAYSSVCMASLGVEVGIVTKVGEDFPRSLTDVFKDAGVDAAGLQVGDRSTNNELIYNENGDKTLKFISRAPNIDIEDIPQEYFDASIFCINPMDHEVNIDTVKKICGIAPCTVADLGGYGGGTSAIHPSIKNGKDIKKIAPYLEVAKASLEDLRYIFGEDISEPETSRQIIDWGAEIVVITLGSRGAYVTDGKKGIYVPPFPIREFVDQTGAGDCFFAGFLFDYHQRRDPFNASFYGNAASSYIVERSGGVSTERMPDKKEVIRRVETLKKINR